MGFTNHNRSFALDTTSRYYFEITSNSWIRSIGIKTDQVVWIEQIPIAALLGEDSRDNYVSYTFNSLTKYVTAVDSNGYTTVVGFLSRDMDFIKDTSWVVIGYGSTGGLPVELSMTEVY